MPFDVVHPQFERLEKLDRVISLIDSPDKWCKGHVHLPGDRYCIVGAMQWVGAYEELEPVVLQAIWDYRIEYTNRGRVRHLNCEQFFCIERFNDHDIITHADVIGVFLAAQDRLINLSPPPTLYVRARRVVTQFWHMSRSDLWQIVKNSGLTGKRWFLRRRMRAYACLG